MKIARTVLLICAMIGSVAPPIFFLAVRHFHLESETAEWLASLWPDWAGTVPLEDRRGAADLAIGFGETAAARMLAYTAVLWCAVFVYSRFLRTPSRERKSS